MLCVSMLCIHRNLHVVSIACVPALGHEGVEQLREDVLLGDEIMGQGGDGEELDGERGHAERVLVVVADEVAHHGTVTLQQRGHFGILRIFESLFSISPW